MSRIYAVDGACLFCTLGTTEGKIKVTSQSKVYIQGKLKVTSADKTVLPTFGHCKRTMGWPTPCSPKLKDWKNTSRKATIGENTFVMDDSMNQCSYGGLIFVKDHLQNEGGVLVGTGRAVLKSDGDKAPFQGYILFVNGNISAPIANFAGIANALFGTVPEKDHKGFQGQNVDEQKGHEDIDSGRYSTERMRQEKIKEASFSHYAIDALKMLISPVLATIVTSTEYTNYDRFVGYWDQESNDHQFVKKYAAHFDATGNEHFINGSHGLGSKANHRMDHGLAQGYAWAKTNLPFFSKKDFDKNKDRCPGLHEPKNMPITIVMHSQGNAMGLGVVKGIGKYMSELGWDKIALNLVCLSVHQNLALNNQERKSLIDSKSKMLAPDYLMNWLEQLFERRETLESDIGINEYASGIAPDGYKKKITKFFPNWESIKKHGVQFTFANDRSDIVTRMGDLPGMQSAYGPNTKINITSFEIKGSTAKIPEYSLNRLPQVDTVEDEVVTLKTPIPLYEKYVEIFMLKYNEYYKELEYYNKFPRDRFITGANTSMPIDMMRFSYDNLVNAYGTLWNAEVYVHSAPVAWLDQKKLMEKTDASTYDLIREHGKFIFYRKANRSASLLNIIDIYKK